MWVILVNEEVMLRPFHPQKLSIKKGPSNVRGGPIRRTAVKLIADIAYDS